MIAAYIRPERTIILMVCGARADLEAPCPRSSGGQAASSFKDE